MFLSVFLTLAIKGEQSIQHHQLHKFNGKELQVFSFLNPC